MEEPIGVLAALVALTLIVGLVIWAVHVARRHGVVKTIRLFAPGLLGGFITGLLGGGLGRLAMRVVSLASAEPPRLSMEGTLSLLRLGVHLSLPLALILVVVRQHHRGTWLQRGAILALIAVTLVGAPMLLSNQGGEVFRENATLGVLLLLGVFLLCGFVLAWTVEVAAQYLGRSNMVFPAIVSASLAVPAILSVWVFSFILVKSISAAAWIWLFRG